MFQSKEEMETSHLSAKVFVSEVDNAPNRMTVDVMELCEIKVKLDIPYHSLPKHKSSFGKKYRRITYDIEMSFCGGSLKFEVIVNGVRQPAQNVEVAFA